MRDARRTHDRRLARAGRLDTGAGCHRRYQIAGGRRCVALQNQHARVRLWDDYSSDAQSLEQLPMCLAAAAAVRRRRSPRANAWQRWVPIPAARFAYRPRPVELLASSRPSGWSAAPASFLLAGRSIMWVPSHASVEDCALLLDALAGYDPLMPTVWMCHYWIFPLRWRTSSNRRAAIQGTRIGIPEPLFLPQSRPRGRAGGTFSYAGIPDLGAILQEVEIPASIDEMYEVYRGIQRPEAYTFHEEQGWLESSVPISIAF